MSSFMRDSARETCEADKYIKPDKKAWFVIREFYSFDNKMTYIFVVCGFETHHVNRYLTAFVDGDDLDRLAHLCSMVCVLTGL